MYTKKKYISNQPIRIQSGKAPKTSKPTSATNYICVDISTYDAFCGCQIMESIFHPLVF